MYVSNKSNESVPNCRIDKHMLREISRFKV